MEVGRKNKNNIERGGPGHHIQVRTIALATTFKSGLSALILELEHDQTNSPVTALSTQKPSQPPRDADDVHVPNPGRAAVGQVAQDRVRNFQTQTRTTTGGAGRADAPLPSSFEGREAADSKTWSSGRVSVSTERGNSVSAKRRGPSVVPGVKTGNHRAPRAAEQRGVGWCRDNEVAGPEAGFDAGARRTSGKKRRGGCRSGVGSARGGVGAVDVGAVGGTGPGAVCWSGCRQNRRFLLSSVVGRRKICCDVVRCSGIILQIGNYKVLLELVPRENEKDRLGS